MTNGRNGRFSLSRERSPHIHEASPSHSSPDIHESGNHTSPFSFQFPRKKTDLRTFLLRTEGGVEGEQKGLKLRTFYSLKTGGRDSFTLSLKEVLINSPWTPSFAISPFLFVNAGEGDSSSTTPTKGHQVHCKVKGATPSFFSPPSFFFLPKMSFGWEKKKGENDGFLTYGLFLLSWEKIFKS
ncbi:hypothetical protein CEXT_73261 [Caerostris extrusa]|uniref:Uncharacterized protein n=1 Tax=Caerostris extrusa TaxID=172846 RepID=A0AAV4XKY6_CAEEX|nr:hypothetical protein CEXT_73261 [Caerostris extrusa]